MDDHEAGSEAGDDQDDQGEKPNSGRVGSRWEWIAAGISFILVGAAIGFLILNADGAGPPPAIEIAIDSIVRSGDGFLVEFRAENSSITTAAAVLVEGTLRSDAAPEPERSQVTFDYVPGMSSRAGGLYFTRDPRAGILQIRPLGYASP